MFRGIMGYEFKKLFIRRNIIILALIFILLGFFCWRGISDYKSIINNKKPFQEMERDKVSMHLHYTFYGVRGVRLLYIPSPLCVIFNDSAVFTDMTSHVDTAVKIAKNGIEIIVLNDFFKQKTREFEEDFFKLISTLEASAQKILYLSCNIYYPKKPLDESFKIDTFYLLPLPIDKVTLR